MSEEIPRKLQCKDIPDEIILRFLLSRKGIWCTWFPAKWDNSSVMNAVDSSLPGKLVHAKMKMLMRRGLVTGCPCGCRGDFEITPKGEQWLESGQLQDKEDGE